MIVQIKAIILVQVKFTDKFFGSLRFTIRQFASPRFTIRQLSSPRFTSPRFTSPRFTSPRLTSLRFTSPCPVQSNPRYTVSRTLRELIRSDISRDQIGYLNFRLELPFMIKMSSSRIILSSFGHQHTFELKESLK